MRFKSMRGGAIHDCKWIRATGAVRLVAQRKFFDGLQSSPVLRYYRLLLSGVACVPGLRVATHCGGLLAALARSYCTRASRFDLSESDRVVHTRTLVCVFSIARKNHACQQ